MGIIAPQPGGQTNFFKRTEFELLYGGCAGPGKTWALVIDALGIQYKDTPLGKTAVEVPEYRGILFRRQANQLGKIIDEAKTYYCTAPYNARFVTQRIGEPGPSFTFPSGAKIYCCHLQLERDKENHQGQEYQYIGFDELTQFLYSQYIYLFSRARSKIPFLKPRIRATTNPTGIGLKWVKERFYKGMEPRKTYYFIQDRTREDNYRGIAAEKDTPKALSRTYIPGKLKENKILMNEDPGYPDRISAMGPKYERALLYSDWDAFTGDFFPFDPDKMVIEPFNIPKEWTITGSLDPGWGGTLSFGLKAIDLELNQYRLATYQGKQKTPQQNAEDIIEFIRTFPYTQDNSLTKLPPGNRGRMPTMIPAGRDAWAKKDRYSILASDVTLEQVFTDAGLPLIPAVTDRKNGWGAWKSLMIQGQWLMFDWFNEALRDEIMAAVPDENDADDIKGKGNNPEVPDHALDEERYSVMSAPKPRKKAEDKRTESGMKQAVRLASKKPRGMADF